MTCQNNSVFMGDDLVDIITVNRPSNTDDLTITRCEVQVGNLLYVEENPTFPYNITIDRTKSVQLSYQNPIYMRIYYDNGAIRRTCVGTLTLSALKQVVQDVQLST